MRWFNKKMWKKYRNSSGKSRISPQQISKNMKTIFLGDVGQKPILISHQPSNKKFHLVENKPVPFHVYYFIYLFFLFIIYLMLDC